MPITSPWLSNSGPPELPWLMAASVWMKLSKAVAWMSRLRPLTMPELTEPPSPSGLPMAITVSPTTSLSLSPSVTVGSGFSGRTRISARSASGLSAVASARSWVLSCRVTMISEVPPTTW